jgi:hypothetical protein
MPNQTKSDISNLENEIWKDIENYECLYQVSNFGRIKSFIKHNGTNIRILKLHKDKDDYFNICLYKNKNKKIKRINILVFEAFRKKLEDGYDIHHIDEDRKNNFVENLEPKLHKDHRKGEKHSEETKKKISKSHKLSEQKLADIKIDIEKKELSQKIMAEKHGVAQSTISNIKNNLLN